MALFSARALSQLTILVLASALAASAATIGPLAGSGFAIPDNDPTGATSVINNPTGGAITDVTVAINFGDAKTSTSGHTWIGDMIVTLEFGGATGTLFHRVGSSTGTGSGDSSDALGLYTFNDSFTGDLWAAAVGIIGGDVPAGNYFPVACCAAFGDPAIPSNLNSSFAGLDAAGAWTLRISDSAGGDTGGIVGWELTIETSDATAVPEPGTITLLGLGLLGLAVAGKRRFGR